MGEEEEERRKKEAGAAPGGPVTLNVGGKLYSTTRETLTRVPDSMLGAMFRGPWPAPPGTPHFIDRDGKPFRHVLNFLRLGRLDLPEGYPELALLRAEADFYQIRPLLAALDGLAAQRRRPPPAVLHLDLACRERLLHFTVRAGPQSYGLSTASLRLFAANVFCTDPDFVALLRGRLGRAGAGEGGESGAAGGGESGAAGGGESGAAEEEESGAAEEPGAVPGLGPGAGEAGEGRSQHHLHLEWAPRPPALPAAEYAKQKVRPLRLGPPEGREIATAPAFLEEVLKMALDQGFRVDAVFPDPEDILRSRSLRFVRH